MTTGSAAAHVEATALLERALGYTLGCVHLVTPEAMARPTPCRAWDVRALLAHMNDSLRTLADAISVGHLDLDPVAGPDTGRDPVGAFRAVGCELMGAWAASPGPHPMSVSGLALPSSVVAATGAVEVAVHGWDVARACGVDRPIPAALADELLDLCPLVVTGADRPARFGWPVPSERCATPGERLVGFLGRDPR